MDTMPVMQSKLYGKIVMSAAEVQQRMERVIKALRQAGVPHAIIGGQAVALWVSTRDPAATRHTKDVDILLKRSDLAAAREAIRRIDMDYFETMGIGMFLENASPSPKHAVHLVWAGERPSAYAPVDSPTMAAAMELEPGVWVVRLAALVTMKLNADRPHDQVHLHDMINVGLIGPELLDELPEALRPRYERLLSENAG